MGLADILDGKQRLTTIFDFIDGRYPLDMETPSVTIDDAVYELGGKYFTDLDIECQQELLRFKFTIYGFEDADDNLIEEIFFRLNNSTPLSKPHKAMPLCGVENAKFIKSILSDRFFSEICQFSALQRRKSDDMCTLLYFTPSSCRRGNCKKHKKIFCSANPGISHPLI